MNNKERDEPLNKIIEEIDLTGPFESQEKAWATAHIAALIISICALVIAVISLALRIVGEW